MSEIVKLPIEVENTFNELLQKHKGCYKDVSVLEAACLYAAFRIHHQPRTLNEMAELTGVPYHYIGHAFKRMKLKISLSKPEEYIDRYIEKLKIAEYKKREVSDRAKSIIDSARHCEDFCCVCNKVPSNVASGAVYISSILWFCCVGGCSTVQTVGVARRLVARKN
jgi:transcription initiation factor TFIIB